MMFNILICIIIMELAIIISLICICRYFNKQIKKLDKKLDYQINERIMPCVVDLQAVTNYLENE